MHAEQDGGGGFSMVPMKTLAEMAPSAIGMLQKRTGHEVDTNNDMEIFVTIDCLGWRRSSGGSLWIPNQTVTVDAPMLVLHNHPLRLKTVTFKQDNQTGTRSTLELVNRSTEKVTPKGPGGGNA